MKLAWEDRILHGFIYVFLTALGLLFLYPFWNALMISFNIGADTALGGITIWPRAFTLENYEVVLQDARLLRAFYISVMRTLAGTVLGVLLTAMFGYAMSKKELLGRKYYMILCVITMYFSGGLIPSYLLIRSLGLRNSFWVMVIPGLINVWHMIIFRTFFMGLPSGLEESAKLDGANHFQIFFRIVLPLSGPVIATIALFTAVHHWNSWFDASIYITQENLLPIQTLLNQIINSNIATQQLQNVSGAAADFLEMNQRVTTRSLIMSTMMVATIPIILVYPFLQRYFVKGVLIGSLKE